MIEKILSRIKGEKYRLDPDIPLLYLLRYFVVKAISAVYGMMRLRTTNIVFVHPGATVKGVFKIRTGNNLNIDEGCYIDAMSRNGLVCGKNVNFGRNSTMILSGSFHCIGQGAVIGDNVAFGTHGYYGSGMGVLKVGSDVIFGNYVSVHPENHNYNDMSKPIRLQGVNSRGGVIIGNNCWIGAKATILDGTKIGDGCIVAAGAVVKGTFPSNVIIGGIPAKIIKKRVNEI